MKTLDNNAGFMGSEQPIDAQPVLGVLTRWQVLILAAVVLIAFGVRFYDLGAESYWLDEIIMVRLTTSDTGALVNELITTGRPPLYVLIGHVWVNVFGVSETATRALSAVSSLIAVFGVYALGKVLFGRTVGLVAALLMGLSGFQISMAQDFRYYAMFITMSTLSWLFLYHYVRDGRRLSLALYIICSILLVYTHVYGIFVLLAAGVYFLLRWRTMAQRRLTWIVSQVIILVGIAPGLYSFLAYFLAANASSPDVEVNTTLPTEWIPTPAVYAPVRTLVNFMLGSDYIGMRLVVIIVAVFAAIFVAYVVTRGRGYPKLVLSESTKLLRGLFTKQHGQTLLLLCWLGIPIITVFIFSYIVTPIYWDRYLSAASPALYLFVALLVVQARKIVPLYVSLGLLVVLLLLNLVNYYQIPVKEQWRDSAAFVDANIETGDIAIIGADIFPAEVANVQQSYNYYAAAQANCIVDFNLSGDALQREWENCTVGADRVWLIMRYDQPERIAAAAESIAQASGSPISLVEHQTFTGTSVYLLEL